MKSRLLLMKPNHKSKQIDVLLDVALDNQYLNSSLIMDLSSLILYKIIFLYHSLVTNSSSTRKKNNIEHSLDRFDSSWRTSQLP
jgi:hypothetical protein